MHLDGRPTRDGGLATPLQRLVQGRGFQHPKATDVLLALQVRPVGDEHPTIGLRPQRPCTALRAQAANENGFTGTPSFLLGKSSGTLSKFESASLTEAGPFEAAIEKQLKA